MRKIPLERLLRIHSYVLTFLVCTLSVTVILKIGQIQYLELVMAADLFVILAMFAGLHFQVRVFRPFLSIAKSYGIFLVLTLALALIALRQDFFPFNDNPFKQPLVITVSRMAELFLDVFYMLYLASLYREDERLGIFGAKVYYWMGILSGIYAIATFPLNYLFKLDLGTAGEAHRLRGFNNEGGPYGTYLITVCALTMVMYHKGWMSRRQMRWSMALLLFCMAGSQSKAAFFGLAVTGMLYLMWMMRGWRRWTLVAAASACFAVVGALVNIPAQIAVYEQASDLYQKESNLKAEDANFVMGRVSGAILAPRMIAAHPLLGIGWGNYPLVRDDPQYRQGTAFLLGDVDSPSLGPIDYIVELGFPLWIYLTWISIKPIYLLRLNEANPWILCMAAMQPISNWFGAHLNITYPWVVLGLALGLGFAKKANSAEPAL
jgi:hypothetical protein